MSTLGVFLVETDTSFKSELITSTRFLFSKNQLWWEYSVSASTALTSSTYWMNIIRYIFNSLYVHCKSLVTNLFVGQLRWSHRWGHRGSSPWRGGPQEPEGGVMGEISLVVLSPSSGISLYCRHHMEYSAHSTTKLIIYQRERIAKKCRPRKKKILAPFTLR